jgi:hypothetical protein
MSDINKDRCESAIAEADGQGEVIGPVIICELPLGHKEAHAAGGFTWTDSVWKRPGR